MNSQSWKVDTATPDSCHRFVPDWGHPLTAKAIDLEDVAVCLENWTGQSVLNRTSPQGLFTIRTVGKPMRLPPLPPSNGPEVTFDDLSTLVTVLDRLGWNCSGEKRKCRS